MIPAFRILIVDRLDPFRSLISSILRVVRGFQVVGEASDGLEGVQKAKS
jgi:DNA-binding NarL/FixJ family response regulator